MSEANRGLALLRFQREPHRACPARACAQRGQRRTAVLIPDWLTVSTSPKLHRVAAECADGCACEHVVDVELMVAAEGESGQDEVGGGQSVCSTEGGSGIECPVGLLGGVIAADEDTDRLIDHRLRSQGCCGVGLGGRSEVFVEGKVRQRTSGQPRHVCSEIDERPRRARIEDQRDRGHVVAVTGVRPRQPDGGADIAGRPTVDEQGDCE